VPYADPVKRREAGRKRQKAYVARHKEKVYSKHRAHKERSFQKNNDLVCMYKTEAGCKYCGERRHWCLDLHHRDPATKDRQYRNIADMMHSCGVDRVVDELLKCDVLCANCHRDHHFQEQLNAARPDDQDGGPDS
jgi:hypothetical protein